MKTELSSLQLRFFGLDDIRVVSNDAYEPDDDVRDLITPEVDIYVSEDEDEENVWKVGMRIQVDKDFEHGVPWHCVPYILNVFIPATFEITEEVDEKTLGWLTHMNAPAVLYGLARAEVARLTCMNMYGKFILPSVDFIKMVERLRQESENDSEKVDEAT